MRSAAAHSLQPASQFKTTCAGESEWAGRKSEDNMRLLEIQNPGLAAEGAQTQMSKRACCMQGAALISTPP